MEYSKKDLIKSLKQLSDKLNRVPKYSDTIKTSMCPSGTTYIRYFGSWNQALREAGFETNQGDFNPYSEEELLNIVKNLANEMNRTPRLSDLNKREDLPSPSTYQNNFESWNAVLEKLDIPRNRYNDRGDELLNHLREMSEKLGRTPRVSDIDDADNRPSSVHFHKQFGSWNNALRAAGLEINKIGGSRYTEEELLCHIRELEDELGRTPTGSDMNDDEDRPTTATYRNYFGKWSKALEKASSG